MKLTEPQKEILNHPARFKVVVSGRRFGKTYASIASLAKHASKPNTKVMYVAPSYRMAKQIVWEDLKSCLLYTSPSPRDRTRSRMPSSA